MSGKAAIGKGKGKGKKKEEEEAVKGVAIATGVKWSGERKPTADSQYRRSELYITLTLVPVGCVASTLYVVSPARLSPVWESGTIAVHTKPT